MKKFKHTTDVFKKKRSAFYRLKDKKLIRSKMDFSIMPADGGNIIPHTDHRLKLVTLVLSFINDNEWDNEKWGGGTDVLIPKDRSKIFNMKNDPKPFEEMEHVKTFPFNPNQCVLFIKTYNSWHSVSPMTGPETALRKVVTINIESIV